MLGFKCKHFVGQYTGRCEVNITIRKINALHAHLNHSAEKCPAHVAKIILSSWDILYYLSYQFYFPVTFTTMNSICEIRVKWLLFNFNVLTIVTMLAPRIIKSFPKSHWTSSLWHVASFAKYQINCIIRPNLRISSLISYACFVKNDVKFLVGRICLQILHLGTLQGLHQPSILIRGIFHEDIL